MCHSLSLCMYIHIHTQAGINVITRVLAHELKNENILVNSMCPGFVKTGLCVCECVRVCSCVCVCLHHHTTTKITCFSSSPYLSLSRSSSPYVHFINIWMILIYNVKISSELSLSLCMCAFHSYMYIWFFLSNKHRHDRWEELQSHHNSSASGGDGVVAGKVCVCGEERKQWFDWLIWEEFLCTVLLTQPVCVFCAFCFCFAFFDII